LKYRATIPNNGGVHEQNINLPTHRSCEAASGRRDGDAREKCVLLAGGGLMTRLATSPATTPHTLLKPPAPRPLRRTFHPAEDRFEILLPSVRQIREMRVDAKLREWRPVLARIGLGAEDARAIARRAVANDTGFARELLASGKVVEDRFFRAIAVEVGLGFIARISPKQIVMDADARLDALRRSFGARVMMVSDASGNIIHVMARTDIELGPLLRSVNEHPDLSNPLRHATPSGVRNATGGRTK